MLALDISSSAIGYAVFDDQEKLIKSGVIVGKGKNKYVRCQRMKAQLWNTVQGFGEVVFEEPAGHFKSKAAVVAIGIALGAVICSGSIAPASDHIGINPSTWKKWFADNGRADKKCIIAAVNALGITDKVIEDDNEADAIALGYSYFGMKATGYI